MVNYQANIPCTTETSLKQLAQVYIHTLLKRYICIPFSQQENKLWTHGKDDIYNDWLYPQLLSQQSQTSQNRDVNGLTVSTFITVFETKGQKEQVTT